MPFVRGALTPEQQRKIDENRRRALERLKSKGLEARGASISESISHTSNSIPDVRSSSTSFSQIKNTHEAISHSHINSGTSTSTSASNEPYKRPNLTPEQKAKVERNRQQALERLRARQLNNRDATNKSNTDKSIESNIQRSMSVRMSTTPAEIPKRPLDSIRPSVRRKDYIEYDFSTMTDTRGGFISDDPVANKDGKTLEEWKEEQKASREPAPPLDPANMPKCFECESIEIDVRLYQTFKCRVCKTCREKIPEKYSLLTKTECREDYLLTDPELRDVSLLPRLEKTNPYGGTYSRMQLFLRYQVEEFAYKKWESEEGLDKEWERREQQRVTRRDKKYEMKLREMRKKTRAEEYTRKLREGYQTHVHEWSQPVQFKGEGDIDMVKRRCMDCGLETEEFLISNDEESSVDSSFSEWEN